MDKICQGNRRVQIKLDHNFIYDGQHVFRHGVVRLAQNEKYLIEDLNES